MHRHELNDDEWLLLAPLVHNPMGRPTKRGNRHFLNGVLWKVRTGVAWRDLLSRYGNWKTVYARFRRWANVGPFTAIFRALQFKVDKNYCAIDGSYVRAHQHSAGGRKGARKKALDLIAAARTTKLHARVNGQGRPLQVEVSSGSAHDAAVAPALLQDVGAAMVVGDKGDDSDAIVRQIERAGAIPVILPRRHRKV